jgi:hypothetical protein
MNTSVNPVVDRRTALQKFGLFSRELFRSPYKALWAPVVPFLSRLRYFSAPASSKFHLSCSGGLLTHSVQVTDIAISLASDRFADLDPYKIMLAGLLHDTGKCGLWTEEDGLQQRYIENPEEFPKWPKAQKWWSPYLYEDSSPLFNVRDLSALYAAKLNMPWDVIQAILAHDGLWADANKDYLRSGVHPLLLVIMSADYISSQGLETKNIAIDRRLEK